MILFLALAAVATSPGTHPPEIEKRLAPFVGDWTIPGQEATCRETCSWYGNRAFVVCNSSDTADGSMAQSILGYSTIEQRFTYHNYASSGSSNTRFGFPLGESGLVYTLERRSAAGQVRVTTFLTPEADGRLHFREERSVNGGPWRETANFTYIRRASPAR